MKKKILVLLVVIMVLSMMSIPALAGPPANASGTWTYAPTGVVWEKEAGCNKFTYMTDSGTLDGTFEGEEDEVGLLVEHCHGEASYKGDLTFTGTVGGISGTVEMRMIGKSTGAPWLEVPWKGTWRIISGANGLENLRGQGTWEGMLPSVTYEGNYHFELN